MFNYHTRRDFLSAAGGAVALAAAPVLPLKSAPVRRTSTGRAWNERIIDVHSHAMLPRWTAAFNALSAQERQVTPGSLPTGWSVDAHLKMMDSHGIQAAVLSWPRGASILRGKAARDLARGMNEDYAAIIARYPGRFGAFACLPFDDMDAAVEEMAYALDVLKLEGVICGTNIAGRYLGHPAFDGWLAEMNRRNTVLFVHPSAPQGPLALDIHVSLVEYMFDTTRMITNLVLSGAKKRFSDVRIISTHAGGTIPFLAYRLSVIEPEFGAGPGRPTLSGKAVLEGLASFYFDLTASTAPASFDALRRLVPASRMMLGFDFPYMNADTVEPALAAVANYAPFSPIDRQMIARETALRLFPSLAERIAGAQLRNHRSRSVSAQNA